MATGYDPFSHEAMRDPSATYRRLREMGGAYFIEKFNAWALLGFEEISKASLNEKAVDFTAGQTPEQVLLLSDPVPAMNFMTMNAPEHRRWRSILTPEYRMQAIITEAPRLRSLTRELLRPLLRQGQLDVYRDVAIRVMSINAGYNLGLEQDLAEEIRGHIDDFMHREPGQVGASTEQNIRGATLMHQKLMDFVLELRRHPGKAQRHGKLLMDAQVDGVRLNDEQLAGNFAGLLITGSETTPLATAGTFYYLAKHPAQKAAVMADKSRIPAVFRETLRFDQPTNMLVRRARQDFVAGDAKIKKGQGLLFIYASGNRDETVFERANEFDIFRKNERDLSFGIGGHFCLGVHLASVAGPLMIEEIMDAVGDYAIVEEECERAYGEFLAGFCTVPIIFTPKH